MSLDKTEDRLKEIVELTRLYDVYGPLLSDHKKEIFESYVLDNYSLGEIADQVGMSRQGVRDIVKRCSKELVEYEEKTGFLKKLDELSELIENAQSEIVTLKDTIKDGNRLDTALKLLSAALDRI